MALGPHSKTAKILTVNGNGSWLSLYYFPCNTSNNCRNIPFQLSYITSIKILPALLRRSKHLLRKQLEYLKENTLQVHLAKYIVLQ